MYNFFFCILQQQWLTFVLQKHLSSDWLIVFQKAKFKKSNLNMKAVWRTTSPSLGFLTNVTPSFSNRSQVFSTSGTEKPICPWVEQKHCSKWLFSIVIYYMDEQAPDDKRNWFPEWSESCNTDRLEGPRTIDLGKSCYQYKE